MRIRFVPLWLVAVCSSPLSLQAQPASFFSSPAAIQGPLSLDQALALAAERSFAISAASREVAAAEGSLQQAGLHPNPELNVSVEDTRSETRTTTATIDFRLELGGKRAARLHAAQRGRELAQAELSQAKAELRASVIGAFFAALVAQERVKLAHSSGELATRGADTIARRVAAGKVSPVDETRARVDQANAQLEAVEAAAELEGARQALAMLWGDTQPQYGELTGNVDTLPSRAPATELATQLAQSPALLASRLQADRGQALAAVERSKRHPDIVLSVGAKRDNDLGRTQALIGVSVPLPFFDRNQGAVREAQARAEKAGDEHLAARARLLHELQGASSQLASARGSAQLLRDTVLPAAQQSLEAASRGFEAGKFSFLDVIDAQRALIQARARYLTALATAYQSASAIAACSASDSSRTKTWQPPRNSVSPSWRSCLPGSWRAAQCC